ncbi:hypothetical protein CYLTODRAFT_486567 [Cylindrobasidium torrendii FP15055 ss-10]|uniref:Uncharacterized protein n=1 Tax=Cylindrobasidium torrendii FP15055 ss-10 TaxID=1314674 RepID=A0A0D7BRE2_9AGAR|nr:hypothetical protein CYLTODRAFT_486567 [Cylindrobasidium torrendii FP15055 ss-10]
MALAVCATRQRILILPSSIQPAVDRRVSNITIRASPLIGNAINILAISPAVDVCRLVHRWFVIDTESPLTRLCFLIVLVIASVDMHIIKSRAHQHFPRANVLIEPGNGDSIQYILGAEDPFQEISAGASGQSSVPSSSVSTATGSGTSVSVLASSSSNSAITSQATAVSQTESTDNSSSSSVRSSLSITSLPASTTASSTASSSSSSFSTETTPASSQSTSTSTGLPSASVRTLSTSSESTVPVTTSSSSAAVSTSTDILDASTSTHGALSTHSAAFIIGIILAGILFIALGAAIIACILRSRRKRGSKGFWKHDVWSPTSEDVANSSRYPSWEPRGDRDAGEPKKEDTVETSRTSISTTPRPEATYQLRESIAFPLSTSPLPQSPFDAAPGRQISSYQSLHEIPLCRTPVSASFQSMQNISSLGHGQSLSSYASAPSLVLGPEFGSPRDLNRPRYLGLGSQEGLVVPWRVEQPTPELKSEEHSMPFPEPSTTLTADSAATIDTPVDGGWTNSLRLSIMGALSGLRSPARAADNDAYTPMPVQRKATMRKAPVASDWTSWVGGELVGPPEMQDGASTLVGAHNQKNDGFAWAYEKDTLHNGGSFASEVTRVSSLDPTGKNCTSKDEKSMLQQPTNGLLDIPSFSAYSLSARSVEVPSLWGASATSLDLGSSEGMLSSDCGVSRNVSKVSVMSAYTPEEEQVARVLKERAEKHIPGEV